MKDLPTGPGILFQRKHSRSDIFVAKNMMNKSDGWGRMSFVSEEWLHYESKKPEFIKCRDLKTYFPMERFLSGGEKRIIHEGKILALDGFIKTNSETYAFSFKGCYFHFCPHCKTNVEKKEEEEKRDRFFQL